MGTTARLRRNKGDSYKNNGRNRTYKKLLLNFKGRNFISPLSTTITVSDNSAVDSASGITIGSMIINQEERMKRNRTPKSIAELRPKKKKELINKLKLKTEKVIEDFLIQNERRSDSKEVDTVLELLSQTCKVYTEINPSEKRAKEDIVLLLKDSYINHCTEKSVKTQVLSICKIF